MSEGFLAIRLSKIEKHYTSPAGTCSRTCIHGCVITMFPLRIRQCCWRQPRIPQFPEPEQPEAQGKCISGMTQHQDEVLLHDDNDKKATWTMSFACLSAIFMSLALVDPQWEVTTMSPACLSVSVHGVSLFAIPAFYAERATT